jgi:hypothetical protein
MLASVSLVLGVAGWDMAEGNSPDWEGWPALVCLDDVGTPFRRVTGFMPIAHPKHRAQDALQAVHEACVPEL